MLHYVHRDLRPRDGEPRAATSTFTQLLSSDITIVGSLKFNVALRLHRPYGLLIIMEICKAPTLRLKALNKHSITHIMYIEMENVITKKYIL